jgi:hypothetical protein
MRKRKNEIGGRRKREREREREQLMRKGEK